MSPGKTQTHGCLVSKPRGGERRLQAQTDGAARTSGLVTQTVTWTQGGDMEESSPKRDSSGSGVGFRAAYS